ncbi:tyrosyl-DNA phosphodiesterase 1 [Physocladia obscura]|uniref:Tyrosyl-DNA phosphodiesterase 1 n=1 Tax=Physocladia obscura TaxID=109957 RepID=A0AAD5T7Z7_9FUNG|nr:tyrosyl-DNA phosphodiesterase 1 [Physocladia obscura]
MLDCDFFFSNIPKASSAAEIVFVVHPSKSALEACELVATAPNSKCLYDHNGKISFIFPRVEAYGTHHSKMMIIFYSDNRAHVIIHTANLVDRDWGKKSQMCWISSLLLPKSESVRRGPNILFEADFFQYLNAYGKSLEDLKIRLKDFDFSHEVGAIVASVPGRHKISKTAGTSNTTENTNQKWGHVRLAHLLKKNFLLDSKDDESTLIAQFSSIGSLGKTNAWLISEFAESLSSSALSVLPITSAANSSQFAAMIMKENVKRKKPKFALVFPTVTEVRDSLQGWSAGNSIPFSNENWQKQKNYMKPILHKWSAEKSERVRAMPHVKTFARVNERTRDIAWLVVSSHNLSRAAWGALELNGSQLFIRSYEIGVLLIPEYFKTSKTQNIRMKAVSAEEMREVLSEIVQPLSHMQSNSDAAEVVIWLPYDLPLIPYDASDEPWRWDVDFVILSTDNMDTATLEFKRLPAVVKSGHTLGNAWLDVVVGASGIEAVAPIVVELVGLAKVSLAIAPTSLFATESLFDHFWLAVLITYSICNSITDDRAAGQLRHITHEDAFATVPFVLADAQTLPAGAHTFSLSLDIPRNLFPTFSYTTVDKSEVYSVRYFLRARIPLKDNKTKAVEHSIRLESRIINARDMPKLELIDFVGPQFGSILSLQARRNQFLPLQPISFLYTHHAPSTMPIANSYLELIQLAGIPGPNGAADRRGIERVISTYEIPGVPASLSHTYTLQLTLPQLPPTIRLGPIDISYVVRVVSTFGNAGHEILGPVDIIVLPDVQPVHIEVGWDDAVEMLEVGSVHRVRPRVIQLVQWTPKTEEPPFEPEQTNQFETQQQQQQQQQEFFHQQQQSFEIRTTSPIGFNSTNSNSPNFKFPQQQSGNFQAHPNQWIGRNDSGSFALPQLDQLQIEQARLILIQQEELERERAETARVREEYLVHQRAQAERERIAAEKRRQEEEERRRVTAQQSVEEELRKEREEMEKLRAQVAALRRAGSGSSVESVAVEFVGLPSQPSSESQELQNQGSSSAPPRPPPPSHPPPGYKERSNSPAPAYDYEETPAEYRRRGSISKAVFIPEPILPDIKFVQEESSKLPTSSSSSPPVNMNPALEARSYPKPAPLEGQSKVYIASLDNSTSNVGNSDKFGSPSASTSLSKSSAGLNPQQQKAHNRLSMFSILSSLPHSAPASITPVTTPIPTGATNEGITKSLLGVEPPSIILPTQSQPTKRKWWFSKHNNNNGPSTLSTSLSRQQSQPSNTYLEDLVSQICEQGSKDYRLSVKRNHRVLMGRPERDANKQRVLRDVEGMLSEILNERKELNSVLETLEAEFLVIDNEIRTTFVSDRKRMLTRQIYDLRDTLSAAIHAHAIANDSELQEHFTIAFRPLREELSQSVFYIGMTHEEGKDLEGVANAIWGDGMKVFDTEVQGVLTKELAKIQPAAHTAFPTGSSSGAVGKKGGTLKKEDVICLRPGCGKHKAGYGASKLFCSTHCEKLMIAEQTRAMRK